jgi:hypothetical protein
VEHTAELSILLDGENVYFELGYYRRFGWTRWPDAFGWMGAAIRCCGCGHHETGWLRLGPRCDCCPHCSRPVRKNEEQVYFLPFFMPCWELLTNFEMITFHKKCWEVWPLWKRFINRINATGNYRLSEDGSHVPAHAAAWVGTANPRPCTLATAQLEGIIRAEAGPPYGGAPWSAQVSVDYLELGRFIARFMVSCKVNGEWFGWGDMAIVDVANPADRDAVLRRVREAVARAIESRRIGGFLRGHSNTRSRMFRVTSQAWSLNDSLDWPRE